MMTGTAFYLRAVHGWSGLSALLGASPGALSQVMALSAENDVDVPAITVVQTLRVTILAAFLPIGLSLLGMTTSAPMAVGGAKAGAPLLELALMVGFSTFVAFVLFKVRFPGSWVFGAMVGSATLHGIGWTGAVLPWWISDAAMVAVGAVTGSRFAGTPPRLLSRHLVAGFGSFAVSVTIAACFLIGAVWLTGLPPADLAVAFAPGAQETMMLLALALQLDPVLVGAHHLSRFLVVSLSVPVLARFIIRRTPRT
jgi:membrane AbrB-like protein